MKVGSLSIALVLPILLGAQTPVRYRFVADYPSGSTLTNPGGNPLVYTTSFRVHRTSVVSIAQRDSAGMKIWRFNSDSMMMDEIIVDTTAMTRLNASAAARGGTTIGRKGVALPSEITRIVVSNGRPLSLANGRLDSTPFAPLDSARGTASLLAKQPALALLIPDGNWPKMTGAARSDTLTVHTPAVVSSVTGAPGAERFDTTVTVWTRKSATEVEGKSITRTVYNYSNSTSRDNRNATYRITFENDGSVREVAVTMLSEGGTQYLDAGRPPTRNSDARTYLLIRIP